ncbi:Urea transporter 2 [Seminavis robusta]|uniref:Urea transporter 2 n=1 Tax=Seminavis robusta TaxID=568900 RepID=A0A9N8HIR3_9STRA|nr:Urea transporter 2 [Seminavis robusta]|eukprot:Sro638_g179580.1 Urea transporter 2 (798) ;mRNA; f:21923-24316
MAPPQEEVNAWASYDQTAKTARRLDATRRSEIGRSRHGAADKSRHGDGRFRHSSVTGSRHRAVDLVRASAAGGGVDLSSDFVVEGPRQRRRSSFFQQAMVGKSTTTTAAKLEAVAAKRAELDPGVLALIRGTFPVFFEDDDDQQDNGNDSTVGKWFQLWTGTMPWIQSSPTISSNPVAMFIDLCLRGIGQVVFQNSPMTGLFILVGLFIQSTRVAIHGTISLVVTNALALLLGFDKGLVQSGLFGYNAVLVGLALATFDSEAGGGKHQGYSASTLIGSAVIASFTAILFVMMGKLLVPYKSPPLTLPFNVATLLFLLSTAHMGRVTYDSVRPPSLPEYDSTPTDMQVTAAQFFAGSIRGIGQVFLADNLAAGFLTLIGMALCSRIGAVAAWMGSALGAITAICIGVDAAAIEAGMFGFNASLTVTAMFLFYTPSIGAGILAVIAGVMTVIAQQALANWLNPWGLPFMTLPFCVVCLPFIIIQGTTSIVIAVPLASMTIPEDHLQRVNMLSDGFAFLKEALQTPTSDSRKSSSKMRSKRLTKSLSLLGEALDEADHAQSSRALEATGIQSPTKKNPQKKKGWGTSTEQIQHNETKEAALTIFASLLEQHNNTASQQQIPLSLITNAFQAAGLQDMEALSFASLVLTFIDLDDSGTIDKAEFVAFALVCHAMHTIREKIAQFFEFVDEDNSGSVSFEEIDAALEYLGQPVLDDDSKLQLLELTHSLGPAADTFKEEDDNDEEEMDVDLLVNVVTIAKVKLFASAFHGCDEISSRVLGSPGLTEKTEDLAASNRSGVVDC